MAGPGILERTTNGVMARIGPGIGVTAVLAATVCWASAGVIARKADVPGLPLTFWRLCIVAVLFGGAMAFARVRLTWFAIKKAVPAGAIFGVTAAMFFEAIRHTSVGIATVIAALTPVFAIPAAVRWLGERLTLIGLVCATGAVVGVVMFVAPSYHVANTDGLGITLSIGSTAAWVVYLLITKQAREGVDTLEYMTAMNITAAVTLLPLLVVFDPGGLAPPDHGWGWILLLAFLPGFLGHGLLTWAQPHVDLSVSSVLLQGEPIGAAIAGMLFLGEQINAIQALGMALAFVSLAALARQSIRNATG